MDAIQQMRFETAADLRPQQLAWGNEVVRESGRD
jgi:hypothetical protein